MEHRLSSRTALNLNVIIFHSGLGMLQSKTVDISRHGVLVKTNHITLPLHALVDIAFPAFDPKRTELQRLPAMVVRLTDDGVGLMFSHDTQPNPSHGVLPCDLGSNGRYNICAS